MNLNIRQHVATCDESNNPPSTHGTLNVRMHVQFEDQFGDHYVFDLPIDLEALRNGTLTSVSVRYPQ